MKASSKAILAVLAMVAGPACPSSSARPDNANEAGPELPVTDFGSEDPGFPDLVKPDPTVVDPGTDDGDATDPGVPDLLVPDVPVQPAWGWISAIEWNDVCDQWYLKTQWFGGVRAYFASEPSFARALPHTLGFAQAVATKGACTLYDTGIMTPDCVSTCLCLDKGVECYEDNETKRWCDEDEVCVKNPAIPAGTFDHGICVPLPAHFNVGTITLSGLKTPVVMAPDALDRYKAASLPDPNDLFDAGDAITATTSGGALPPLTFSARGVAPLTLPDNVVQRTPGKPALVRWNPADPESRVQVAIQIGSHDPNPLGGTILCDAPDSDGQVAIDHTLLDQLYYLGCNGQWAMKCSRITRYSRDLRAANGQELELFVGSARNLQVIW